MIISMKKGNAHFCFVVYFCLFVLFKYNNILLRLVYYMVVIRSDIPVLVLFLHHHNNVGSSINLAVYLMLPEPSVKFGQVS